MSVNLSMLAGAGWQFLDNSGNVLSGGKLYTYLAGTTTPAITYTSSTGITANSNPVILNSAGRVPNEIWLTENVSYKFILTDANDVLIGTYDNISGNGDGLATFIATLANASDPAKGDALVGFRQSNSGGNLTGTVNRTVHQKLQESVSILDFGATGNGSTNDTVAIQAAIDAVNENGGGILKAPVGTYVINTLYMKSNVYLLNEPGTTYEKTTGTLSDDNNAFNFYGSETTLVSALTANATIGNTSVTVSSSSGFAVGDWCMLRDNTYISGSAGRNQEIVQIYSIVGTTINLDSSILGIYTTAQSAQLVKILPVENATIDGGTVIVPIGTYCGGGINLDLCVNSSVKNCEIYHAQDNPSVEVRRSYNIDITGNSCFNAQNLSSGGYGYAYSIGESSHHIRVTNNHQERVRESSITNRARFVIFANNTGLYCYDNFINTHGSGCENIVIANNTTSGGNQGITVGFNSHTAGDKHVLVTGNVIADTNASGISVSGTLGKEHTNIIVSNNVINNCNLSISSQAVAFGYVIYGSVNNNYVNANNSTLCTYGILSNACSNINIKNNFVQNLPNGYGISTQTTDRVIISENTVRNVLSYNYRIQSTTKNCYLWNNYSDDKSAQIIGYTVTAGSFVVGNQYKILTVGTTDFTLIGASSNTVGIVFVATGVGVGNGTAYSILESPTVYGNAFQTYTGIVSYDPPNLVDGDGVTTTISVPGVALGAYVSNVSFDKNLQGILLTAWVSATNVVSVRFQNETGGAIDLAQGTLRVQVSNVYI